MSQLRLELMCDGLGYEQAGVLSRVNLVPHVLSASVAYEEGAEENAQETERNGNEAGVLKLKPRLLKPHERSGVVGPLGQIIVCLGYRLVERGQIFLRFCGLSSDGRRQCLSRRCTLGGGRVEHLVRRCL